MADRQDIDALLVGALYGELDAADRARLEAHLSSHPQDRAALEALERTRAEVRRGLDDLPAAEPRASISAMLLQEAARRAPRRAATAAEQADGAAGAGGGLWARLVAWLRPVALNPAFAGAAALLLVAGTATALWVRGGRQVAEPEHPEERTKAEAGRPPALAEPAPGYFRGGGVEGKLDGLAAAALDDSVAREADGDAFEANLADPGAIAVGDTREGAVAGGEPHRARDAAFHAESPRPGKTTAGAPAKPADKRAPAKNDQEASAEQRNEEKKVAETAVRQDAAGAARGDRAEATGAGAATGATGKGAAASGGSVATAPPPPADTGRATRPATDPKTEEWARTAHARLVRLVADGKCPDAGRLGAEIKDRAPEYYAAHVASDRAIRACKAYIENQAKKKADKDYKSRSQTNTYEGPATESKP